MSIFVPALFAGLVAIAVTVAIERLGGRLGGLLGTLPTTIVPASLGLLANEPEVFRQAMNLAPAGMLLNALFLLLWRVLPARLPSLPLALRLGAMLAISLAAWMAGAVFVTTSTAAFVEQGLAPEVVGWLSTVLIVVVGVLACLGGVPAPRGSKRVGPLTLALRGALAGLAIAGSLLIAQAGHGLVAGVASVFPAIFLTAMVSVWWSQGEAVSGGAVGPMMLGSASVAVYAVVAAWLMPSVGAVAGGAIAWVAAALGVTWPANLWLRGRRSDAAAPADPP